MKEHVEFVFDVQAMRKAVTWQSTISDLVTVAFNVLVTMKVVCLILSTSCCTVPCAHAHVSGSALISSCDPS